MEVQRIENPFMCIGVPVTAGNRPRQASWVACTLFRGDLHTIRNVNERKFWTRSGGGKKSLALIKELLRLSSSHCSASAPDGV